jgi:hypothetical protein
MRLVSPMALNGVNTLLEPFQIFTKIRNEIRKG